ncbi:MAG: prepilin-type N-terminal cleavage/methylation domain-containing protein [Planctomycetes bacterium]|nr:prepilin-type N-terminal cleavage/methylation domain-containing protein [Planctomycetota bacterium]
MADRRGNPSAAGFTLAEMLAALGILLVGIVALLGALGSSVGQRRTTDARLAATAACDYAVMRVREEATRLTAAAESDLDLELVALQDQSVPGFEGMTWSATTTVDDMRPDIWLVRIEMRWLEEGEDSSEVFLRILPKSLPLGARVRRFREQAEQTSER